MKVWPCLGLISKRLLLRMQPIYQSSFPFIKNQGQRSLMCKNQMAYLEQLPENATVISSFSHKQKNLCFEASTQPFPEFSFPFRKRAPSSPHRLPLPGCVTLRRSCNFSDPSHFPDLKMSSFHVGVV